MQSSTLSVLSSSDIVNSIVLFSRNINCILISKQIARLLCSSTKLWLTMEYLLDTYGLDESILRIIRSSNVELFDLIMERTMHVFNTTTLIFFADAAGRAKFWHAFFKLRDLFCRWLPSIDTRMWHYAVEMPPSETKHLVRHFERSNMVTIINICAAVRNASLSRNIRICKFIYYRACRKWKINRKQKQYILKHCLDSSIVSGDRDIFDWCMCMKPRFDANHILNLACTCNRLDITCIAAQYGAFNFEHALVIAAMYGNTDICSFLMPLTNGASYFSVEMAVTYNHETLAILLVRNLNEHHQFQLRFDRIIKFIVELKMYDLLRDLIRLDMVNDYRGHFVATQAAQNGDSCILSILLDNNISFNYTGVHNLAYESNHPKLCDWMSEKMGDNN